MKPKRTVRLSLAGDGEEQLPYDIETDTRSYDDVYDVDPADDRSLKDKPMPENQFIQDPALSDVQAMQNTATTLRDAVEAGEYQDAADESDETSEELQNVKDIVETINSNEAWTPGAVALLGNHLHSITRRMGIRDIRTGVDMEDARAISTARYISVEDIQEVINAVDSSTDVLQERSVEALEKLLQSLGESVPSLRSRLLDLCRKIESATSVPAGNVELTQPCLVRRLSVDGKLIESFPEYVNDYVGYGQKLLGAYTETAFQSAMRINVFESNLTQYSSDGFWALLEDKISQISDPRRVLTESQMSMVLPGMGALFGGPGAETAEDHLVVAKMQRYVNAFRPVSISDFTKEADTNTEAPESTLVRAITPSQAIDTVKFFSDLLSQIDVSKVSQSCKAAWMDAKRTICVIKRQLNTADDSFLRGLDANNELLPQYLETVFALSAWPVLNYLTNLVLFGNAFVDYTTLSLNPDNIKPVEAAPPAPTDGDSTMAAPAATTTDDADTGAAQDGEDEPNLEPGEKPTQPDEVPDTGSDPDSPQDATGDGERAVVVDVGKSDEDAEGSEEDNPDAVDVSKPDDENAESDETADTENAEASTDESAEAGASEEYE